MTYYHDKICVEILNICELQQLPIKRTTRKILKVLQSNTFKNFSWFGFEHEAL